MKSTIIIVISLLYISNALLIYCIYSSLNTFLFGGVCLHFNALLLYILIIMYILFEYI